VWSLGWVWRGWLSSRLGCVVRWDLGWGETKVVTEVMDDVLVARDEAVAVMGA